MRKENVDCRRNDTVRHFVMCLKQACVTRMDTSTLDFWAEIMEACCKVKNGLTHILRRSRTGTVWFYTSTNNKRAARPKMYTKSLTRDLKRMYSRLTLVRISINL